MLNVSWSTANEVTRRLAIQALAHPYHSSYMTTSFVNFVYANSQRYQKDDGILLAQQLVLDLTKELGLSVSTTSEVLQVTRPTAYSWLKAERVPQAAQTARNRQVSDAVALIKRLKSKGDYLDMTLALPNGRSVVSLLKAEPIDTKELALTVQALINVPTVYMADITDEELDAPLEYNQGLIDIFKLARK